MRVHGLGLKRVTATALLATSVLLLITACGGGDAGEGFTFPDPDTNYCGGAFAGPGCVPSVGGTVGVLPTCNSDETGIVDACGVAITSAIDVHDPVMMSVTGLTANTLHSITITDPLAAEITPAGGLIAISDGDGNLTLVRGLGRGLAAAQSPRGCGFRLPKWRARWRACHPRGSCLCSIPE